VTFHTPVAYGIVICTVAFMGRMSVRNKRSGWQRQRSNLLMDLLYTWAAANAEMRSARVAPVPAALTPVIGSQLSALNVALSKNGGLSPETPPVITCGESEAGRASQSTLTSVTPD
jgi:hypothetical protein